MPRGRAWALGGVTLVLTTAALLVVRAALDKAHVVLALLLVVLSGSAAGGRALGVTLALASFLVFDVFFLPPYNTLVVADPLDWLVLVAYLATSVVGAQLLARAQREAARAQQRATEVDRLAALGAETLSAPRADDALAAIARVVADTLDVAECEVYAHPQGDHPERLAAVGVPEGGTAPSLAQWVAREGRAAWQWDDGTMHAHRDRRPSRLGVDAPEPRQRDGAGAPRMLEALYPLRVREVVVGVLRLADARGLVLDPTRQRYLDALAHYAALSVERLRLAREAEHATALREADRVKDAVLAAVSHDLRTPLTTIRGLAHAVGADGDERGLVIEHEAVQLNALVSDLLDFSRVRAGGAPPDVALNTADDLMGAVLQQVSGHPSAQRIHASIAPADALLVGRFDLAHALRILGNLLDNAFKYAPPGTPIDFTVRRDDGWLVFEVADRGPGVAPAHRDRIFEPFHRAPGAASGVTGVGLGLAIARGLADAQGGSLTVGERTGGGSVFSLRLPAAELPL